MLRLNRAYVLDNRHNVIVPKFRVLLCETTLYRLDLYPLSLRHARHDRHRTSVWLFAGKKLRTRCLLAA